MTPTDESLSSDDLVQRLLQTADQLGKRSVSRSEFLRETGISMRRVRKHFDTWNDFIRAAGLDPTDMGRIADDEMFLAMKDAFLAAEGICSQVKFERLCRIDLNLYRRRGWGNWIGILSRFREWLSVNATEFPYMDQLPAAHTVTVDTVDQPPVPKSTLSAWSTKGGRRYGSFLNFRGLLHAPLNENGVVFLFGMVALELGYVVESITPGFPDCEAKRRISKSGDSWERIRVEFEFSSRNFLTHGHTVADCDVIVCWEDNWADCPIEVLELKTAIQSLEG